MIVRTRFAPSPTGYLHIGGARTALFSWLYARQSGGQFILRIEDTDVERSTQESVDAILEGMAWLDLDYDEGPFYQMQRMPRYQQVLTQLLAEGKAYRCRCSKERLEALRTQQQENKEKPRYDGHCRDLNLDANGGPFVVRFRNPTEGVVSFDDQVRGTITFANSELDDLIIARSDGTPTYNFCVVVDDYDMQITHVIRGDDHINNTPRQINILRALGATVPVYAHLPMILGPDGKRFSKRHGAVSVMQYRDDGYLPEALLNYLVRLGWAYGDQEIFSREEMIQYFSLKAVSKAAAAFNPEKLLWLNQHYIKTSSLEYVAEQLAWQLHHMGVSTNEGPALTDVVLAQRERAKTLKEMAEKSRCFYEPSVVFDEAAVASHMTAESLPVLIAARQKLAALADWQEATIHEAINQIASEQNLKLGKIAQPIRVAITGNTISPSIDTTLRLMGKDRTLKRLEEAINILTVNA